VKGHLALPLLVLAAVGCAPPNLDVEVCVEAIPGYQLRELDKRFEIEHRSAGSEVDRTWALWAGEKKVLENVRAPLETLWVRYRGQAYLVITDHHATGNTRLWVCDPVKGECRRVDESARRDLAGVDESKAGKLWSRAHGVRLHYQALHISVTTRTGSLRHRRVWERTRHYDVDIPGGEILNRYPAVTIMKLIPYPPDMVSIGQVSRGEDHVVRALTNAGVLVALVGSSAKSISVPSAQRDQAISILKLDSKKHGYTIYWSEPAE